MTQLMYQPFVSSAKNKKYSVYVKSASGMGVLCGGSGRTALLLLGLQCDDSDGD